MRFLEVKHFENGKLKATQITHSEGTMDDALRAIVARFGLFHIQKISEIDGRPLDKKQIATRLNLELPEAIFRESFP